jgi:hypothetical protein
MDCDRCRELQLRYEIRSLGELTMAIRVIHANLDDGTIVQALRTDGLGVSTEPFSSVNENGPWPDYLLYDFECHSCGSRFQLSVDVYRGSGGEWLPVEGSTV